MARDAELAGCVETVPLEQLFLGEARAVDEELGGGARAVFGRPRLALAVCVAMVGPVDVGDEGQTVRGVAAGEGGGAAIGLCGVHGAVVICEDGLEEGRRGETESQERGRDGRGGSHCKVGGHRKRGDVLLNKRGGQGEERRIYKNGLSAECLPESGSADAFWASSHTQGVARCRPRVVP